MSYRLVPYYRWRYGERGSAFARSDSAWLVTLCRRPPQHVLEQVEWLGSLLSSRGMPRWLLEIHLDVLYRELIRVRSNDEPAYRTLLIASFHLRDQRLGLIPASAFDRLSEEFARNLGSPGNRWLVGTGRLLVSAVADEKGGIPLAVSKLEEWLTDPDRFEEASRHPLPRSLRELARELDAHRFSASVRQTIEAARDS